MELVLCNPLLRKNLDGPSKQNHNIHKSQPQPKNKSHETTHNTLTFWFFNVLPSSLPSGTIIDMGIQGIKHCYTKSTELDG